jgi:hypothetical protein
MSSIPAGAAHEITLWFRKNERGIFDFNHVEDEHCLADTPTPKVPEQVAWKKGKWIKEHAWFDGSTPAKVLRDPDNRNRTEAILKLET